jgi:3-dehydroquinate synthase
MRRVEVNLPAGRYPIEIEPGGMEGLGAAVRRVHAGGRVVVVTNPVVGALYGAAAVRSLEAAGLDVALVEIPDGEVHKTLATWRDLVEDLVDIGVTRSTPVVALGGGVTGDIAGFAAASVLRGVPLIQVPTTLLAMVDSAVGGKTGVNTRQGKNLVGAFHQPVLVYVPLATLQTLPFEEVCAGLAEVVKHAVIGDLPLWELLEERGPAIATGTDTDGLAQCVARSATLKARIVSEDEREAGKRALLNFGHTVGHAVEAVARGRLRHGECVALGMRAELRHGVAAGRTAPGVEIRVENLLDSLGLPGTVPSDWSRSEMVVAAGHDKKRIRGTLRLPVVDRLGSADCIVVNSREVAEMLQYLDVTTPPGTLV